MMIGTKVPWTFNKWIEQFKGVDLPIGDLAAEILRDKDFPEGCNDFTEIVDYLHAKCQPRVLEVFCETWNFYVASTSNPFDNWKQDQKELLP